MQTYIGHIESGRFYTKNGKQPPDSSEALLVINTPRKNNTRAWRKFFDAVNACGEELPETVDRISLSREVCI